MSTKEAFINQSQYHIDCAARIRVNEEVNKDIRNIMHAMTNKFDNSMHTMNNDLHNSMHAMNDKIDAQLKWIVGTIIVVIVGILPLIK